MTMINTKSHISDGDFLDLCREGTFDEIQAAIAGGSDVNARDYRGSFPLMIAGNKNRTDVVKLLLDSGADPNAKEFEGWTALMSVVDKDELDIEIVRMLLDAGADVNAKNDFDTTPLLRAICWNNRPDIVKLLLDAGADIYARGAIGIDDWEYGSETPVEASARKWDTTLLRMLLAAGADVNRKYEDDETLLIKAARVHASEPGTAETVKVLLEAGADANIRRKDNLTPLIAAAEGHKSPDAGRTIDLLLDAGADPNVLYKGLYAIDYARKNESLKGTEALKRLEAATKAPSFSESITPDDFSEILRVGTVDRVKSAIAAGADVNAKNRSGKTPLCQVLNQYIKHEEVTIWAQKNNDYNAHIEGVHEDYRRDFELIELLIESGAAVKREFRDGELINDGITPLISASRSKNPDLIHILLNAGADVNAKSKSGNTALMMAARCGCVDVVKLLLEAGADVNAKDDKGGTALMDAAWSSGPDVVKLLLDAGSAVNERNEKGWNALVFSAKNKNSDVARLLLEARADFYMWTEDGTNPLMEAVKEDNADVARMLLKAGANVDIRNKEGMTILMMAAAPTHCKHFSSPDQVLVKLLLDAGVDVNAKDSEGWTALLAAADSDYTPPEIIEMLLDAGADANIEHNGLRALSYARKNEKLKETEVLKRLEKMTKPVGQWHISDNDFIEFLRIASADEIKAALDAGANANAHNGCYQTALTQVCSSNAEYFDLKVVKLLLDAGANVNGRTKNGHTALMVAINQEEPSLEGIKLLLDAGADPDVRDSFGRTALMKVAGNFGCTNPDVIKLLLDAGANPNIECKGMRALNYARTNEFLRGSQALKELEARTAPPGPYWCTKDEEFAELCKIGSLKEIKTALNMGANINSRGELGKTVLMEAVHDHETPNAELIRFLINAGADVNAKEEDGATVLINACYNYKLSVDIIRLLLNSGANVNARSASGTTPLMAAVHHNSPDVVKLLLERGVDDINARTSYGATALMEAVHYNSSDVIRLLLDAGADVDLRDKDGRSAADYASMRPRRAIEDMEILKRIKAISADGHWRIAQ